jgi:hypothetical protein
MNSRRLNIRLHSQRLGPPPVRDRTLSLPQKGRKVLGLNLNRSEFTWGAANPSCFQPNDSTPRWSKRPLHCGMSTDLCPEWVSRVGQRSRPLSPDVRFTSNSV